MDRIVVRPADLEYAETRLKELSYALESIADELLAERAKLSYLDMDRKRVYLDLSCNIARLRDMRENVYRLSRRLKDAREEFTGCENSILQALEQLADRIPMVPAPDQ